MKKIIYVASVFASLVAVSCVKEDVLSGPQHEMKGTKIEFVGTSNGVETKISIGEKDGQAYPLLWQAGDVISVWSSDLAAADLPSVDDEGNSVPGNSAKIIGEQAELFEETAGKTSGTFTTVNPLNVTENTDVIITYPASAKYVDGKVTSKVEIVQTQRSANSSLHVGNNTLAYAKTVLRTTANDAVSFNLLQQTAFVKLVLSTTEYASLELVGAKLYAPGAKLSGNLSYDITENVLTVTDDEDNVGVNLRNPESFASPQTLYFTAIPCDLTGKECYVVITMQDATKTVTIPAKISGGRLEASKLSVITINNISAATNECTWYEPVETRYIAGYGEGWAYGPQNCYVAYFAEDGDFGESVTFDVKARGNFTACSKPAKVIVYAACELNVNNKSNLEVNGTVCHDGNGYVSYDLGADYTLTVRAKKAGNYTGYSSKIFLLDENDKTIWSFNIWGNAETLKEQTFVNGVMLDRNIGQTNHEAAEGEGYHGGSYYQWGRPFQTGWSSSGGLFANAASDNTGFAESAAKPEVFFKNDKDKQNWYSAGSNPNAMNDLWGNENLTGQDVTSEKGVKSIFDPCPEGWMVASPKLMEEIMANAEPMYTDVDAEGKTREGGTHNWLVYELPNGENALFDFSGCKWGNTAGNPNSNKLDIAALWSNSNGAGEGRAYNMMFRWKSKENETQGWTKVSYRALGFPVRCMKDTENR